MLRKANIGLQRIKARRSAKSLMLIGLRGAGKTVLLFRIREQAEAAGYKALLVEVPEDKSLAEILLPPLRQILLSLDAMENLSAKVKRGLRVLKSFASGLKVKIGDLELGLDAEVGAADSGDLESDLGNLMVAVAEAGADRGTAVALCLDELQYLSETDLGALIMALHQVAQKQLPLVMFGAALPQIVAKAGRSKSYAERLFEFPEIGPLAPEDAREALSGPVGREGVIFLRDALDEIVKVTEGYPYFLQQWGYEAWEVAQRSPIDLATVRTASELAVQGLDQSFFRVRFDRLTPREKTYLRAMAAGGAKPQRSGEIAARMGVKVTTIAPVRSNLIQKGMLYSSGHGETAFTVPLFDRFMLRALPDWP